MDQTILFLPQRTKIYYEPEFHVGLNPALEIIETRRLLKLHFAKDSEYKLPNSNTEM